MEPGDYPNRVRKSTARYSPGDYVKLKLAKFKEVEGRVLESYDSDIVLIKLKSGYNVGIPKENILGSRVVRKFREEKVKKKLDVGKKDGKKSIGLIVTGGTIASKLDSRTGGVKPLTSVEEFAKYYPGLFEKVNVKKVEVPFMIASESMSSEHWIRLAQCIKDMLDDKEIEGVILTHGTDFLHYTSAALSFMLRDLNKPVVLTYSQRSIDRASSDAELNLDCAVEMALSDCAEVVLVGHASMNDDYCYAFPGTKVRKLHTSRRDAFKTVNDKPIAKIVPGKEVEFLSEYRPRNDGNVELDTSWKDVGLVKFYPGQNPDILDFYKLKYKGIVVEAAGLGHVATAESKDSWLPKLRKYIKEGFIVCAAAQTINGRLDPKVYSAGRELEKAGVIFLEDMLAETAFVKLGWVLGHSGAAWKGKEKVREKMLINIAGEFNELLSE